MTEVLQEKMYDMVEVAGRRLQKMIEGTELFLDDIMIGEDRFVIHICELREGHHLSHIVATYRFSYEEDEETYGCIEAQLEDSLDRFESWFGRE